jgi:3-keto-L-gulonate-6-phosphate decarboxylase
LEVIVQKEDELLRNCIERFNKVVAEVKTDDRMKLYLLDRELCQGSDFKKVVGIEEIRTLDAFLEKAQKYIQYEEKQTVENIRKPKYHKGWTFSLRKQEEERRKNSGSKTSTEKIN